MWLYPICSPALALRAWPGTGALPSHVYQTRTLGVAHCTVSVMVSTKDERVSGAKCGVATCREAQKGSKTFGGWQIH